MSNFSTFFPSGGGSGGGGGLLNINKYSTARSLKDTDIAGNGFFLKGSTQVTTDFNDGAPTVPSWSINVASVAGGVATGTITAVQFNGVNRNDSNLEEDAFKGFSGRFSSGMFFTSILTSSAGTGTGPYNITFTTPNTTTGGMTTTLVNDPPPVFTVNPATDLSLSDGALLGYLMVGGGSGGNNIEEGGAGGRILQRSIIVTTAATNLILTIGIGGAVATTGTASTITGGLTLSTTDGSNGVGWNGGAFSTQQSTAAQGINGYGAGGSGENGLGGTLGNSNHGFGGGGDRNVTGGGDGAILLYY